jgi:hypothetical protein
MKHFEKTGEFDVEHRPLDFEHQAERRRAEDDNWVASMGLERVRDLSFLLGALPQLDIAVDIDAVT